MKHTEFSWYGSDSQLVFAQIWQPKDTETKATIILVHGMGEHSSRYEHMAKFFTANGYAILTFDLRGHGKSEGKRGHVSDYNVFLNQITRALEESSKRFPGEPKFIYGHSMGGNIAITYALRRMPRVLGVAISAPWIKLGVPAPKHKVLMAKMANYVYGGYTESNGLVADHLSRDPKIVEDYINDELVHDKVSARLFFSGTERAQQILSIGKQLTIPMLLMHGTEDKITSPEGSRELAAAAPNYVQLKEWEGFYHELHNEPEKQEVFDYVLEWMEKHLHQSVHSS